MLGAFTIPPTTSLKLSPETTTFHRKTPSPKRPLICAAVAVATPPESLYEVLQVKQNASLKEIKTAYRTLAKLYHPDVCESQKEFMQIHAAYSRLSDPEMRAEYDLGMRLKVMSWRRGGVRYRVAAEDVRARAGVYATPARRWETDQCW